MATRYVLVPGTNAVFRSDGDVDQWWQPGSPFSQLLAKNDCLPVRLEPFYWSSDVDGTKFWPWQWFRKDNHRDWRGAAWAFIYYMRDIPLEERNVIAHSHGLQVVLYAASYGLKVNRLISVMSPVRADMEPTAYAALPNIGAWLHIHSDSSDKMQVFGSIFDGRWGIHRTHPLATNLHLPKVGHSTILKSTNMALWETEGLIDFLKGHYHARLD